MNSVIFRCTAALISGYFLGSILPAYFIGRLKGIDIRREGSGNPGAANSTEVFGFKIGFLTAGFDIVKAPLSILLAGLLDVPEYIAYAAGFAAVTGHIVPFYLKFKGGKGLASAAGIMLYIMGLLLISDWRYCFFFIPAILGILVLFIIRIVKKIRLEKISYLLLIPFLLISAILYYGLTWKTAAFSAAGIFMITKKLLFYLSVNKIPISAVEKKLLRRKWLRPFAVIFPVGILIHREITLIILTAVLLVFIILEVIRFTSGLKRFPLQYREKEKRRVSSMTMFLFASLLVLFFFPAETASLALMFTIFGDLFAWAVGNSVKGTKIFDKTAEGGIAFFISSLFAAVVYFQLGYLSLLIGISGAAAAAIIEIMPIGEDNLSVSVVSVVIMTGLEKII